MSQHKVKWEKVAGTSGDVLEAQIGKLRGLFPEVFVEGKIDFDRLKATLGGAAESGPGRFSFSWAGKDDARSLLQTPSRATLIPCQHEIPIAVGLPGYRRGRPPARAKSCQ